MNHVNSDPILHFPSHPDRVQSHSPVDKLESRVRGVPIEIESEIKALISNSELVTTDDGNDDSVTEIINNDFRLPIDTDGHATGTVIEEDGILYAQKCLMGEFY